MYESGREKKIKLARNSKLSCDRSIIVLSALIVTLVMPSAFAAAGTINSYYWQTNPEFCYTTQLNDIEIDGLIGKQSIVETELDKVVDTYNGNLGSITIQDDDGSCPTNYIKHESESHGTWGPTATATTNYDSSTNAINYSIIEYTTDKGFGSDVNVCTNQNKDIEWTANHEVGHSVGLKHHFDLFIDHSVMEPHCVSSWSTLSSADKTALDINY